MKINYGTNTQVKSFGEGFISVAILYTLRNGEKAENVQAVYMDTNGGTEWVIDSSYDSQNKMLRFQTNHFSMFGVGYKETTNQFTDIAKHWAKDSIQFVVSRELFKGTSAKTFEPNMTMTRGMFVTV